MRHVHVGWRERSDWCSTKLFGHDRFEIRFGLR